MAEESPATDAAREAALTKIKQAVHDLEASRRESLFGELLKNWEGATGAGARKAAPPRKEFHIRFVVMILLILVGAVLLTYVKGREALLDASIDTKMLVAVLAFVVSLAAYLASVAREIVKRLGESDLADKERKKAQFNVAWTTTAEMQLVLLGLFILIRVAFGSGPFIASEQVFLFDNFLAIYLGLILFFLAGLHVRVWWKYPAFFIEKD